ncbi:hypothetical protein D3C85_968930 [compost metagenome]
MPGQLFENQSKALRLYLTEFTKSVPVVGLYAACALALRLVFLSTITLAPSHT